MSLFKIERAVEEKKEEIKEDATEVKVAGSEEPTEAVTPTEGEPFGLEGKKQPEVVLKVTGALGGVFTTALNKMLAVESMVMIPMSQDALEETVDDSIVPVVIHAQMLDPEVMRQGDVVDLISDVSQNENESYVLGVERITDTPVLPSLNRMSAFKNVDVKYTLNGAVGSVVARCKAALA